MSTFEYNPFTDPAFIEQAESMRKARAAAAAAAPHMTSAQHMNGTPYHADLPNTSVVNGNASEKWQLKMCEDGIYHYQCGPSIKQTVSPAGPGPGYYSTDKYGASQCENEKARCKNTDLNKFCHSKHLNEYAACKR